MQQLLKFYLLRLFGRNRQIKTRIKIKVKLERMLLFYHDPHKEEEKYLSKS